MYRLRSRVACVAVAIGLMFGASACGDDDGGAPNSRGAMIDRITNEMMGAEDMGIDRGQARCVAETLVDQVGFDRLKSAMDEYGSIEDIEDDELSTELGFAALGALVECVDDPEGLIQVEDD